MTREIGTGVERKGNTWMLVPTPPWGDERTQWEELSKEKKWSQCTSTDAQLSWNSLCLVPL